MLALDAPRWFLPLLLLHEEVHQKGLLPVDLETDVFGNVRDQPVDEVTHQHHSILQLELRLFGAS